MGMKSKRNPKAKGKIPNSFIETYTPKTAKIRPSWKIPSELRSRVKTKPYFLFLFGYPDDFEVNFGTGKYNFFFVAHME
jgi:hypothetical protein